MEYRTRVGDTMFAIAARFDIGLAALEAANPQIANPDLIFPNELIHIPGSGSHPVPHSGATVVPPGVVTCVVQSGDTMSGIAVTHNVTLAALEAANPQVTDPALIHPGDVVNLPSTSAQRAHAPMSPVVSGGQSASTPCSTANTPAAAT